MARVMMTMCIRHGGGGGVEWPKGSIPRFDLVYCAPNQLKLIPHRYNSISGTLNGRKQVENRKRNKHN